MGGGGSGFGTDGFERGGLGGMFASAMGDMMGGAFGGGSGEFTQTVFVNGRRMTRTVRTYSDGSQEEVNSTSLDALFCVSAFLVYLPLRLFAQTLALTCTFSLYFRYLTSHTRPHLHACHRHSISPITSRSS